MTKAKKGDEVRFLSGRFDGYTDTGFPRELISHGSSAIDHAIYDKCGAEVVWANDELAVVKCPTLSDKGYTQLGFPHHLITVINSINHMNIKEKFLLAFKSEPQKSFRQKGITNGDDLLTEEGTAVFLGYLLNKYGADFKTTVVDLIENDK